MCVRNINAQIGVPLSTRRVANKSHLAIELGNHRQQYVIEWFGNWSAHTHTCTHTYTAKYFDNVIWYHLTVECLAFVNIRERLTFVCSFYEMVERVEC
jgi:hypothetical protein